MKTNYLCPFCEKDTKHSIVEVYEIDGAQKSVSELDCDDCDNVSIHVKHEKGKIPIHSDERVLYPHEDKTQKTWHGK